MLKPFLYLLSLGYGLAVYLRNAFYDYNLLKSTEFEIPVISIGNITVGGTGKTPHTEYLVELLKKHVRVATLSRGYKRKTKGFLLVQPESDVASVGDEPLQIKRKFPEVTVAVDEKRVHGIQTLLNDENQTPDVILLDDAFQHRSVTPGINILLIDYNRPIDKDHLLPWGRLRERKYQRRRANVIIYTKCPDEITPITRRIIMKDVNLRPYQSLYFTTMIYGTPQPVFPALARPMPDFHEKRVSTLMLSGIANPDQFRNYLSSKTNLLDELVFEDHHEFTAKDFGLIAQKYDQLKNREAFVLTTEKDAVRLQNENALPDELKASLYFVPVKIKFLDSEGKSFDKKIVGYVKDNRSNRALYHRKDQATT
ncbi:tetraacyldisaccharide 4'-kinase [Gaoshiqia sediminis]|uniref:Tetraacyldisaccharide 4'-kinase n=1 Tax=Gaoshiqia sediminis TaxID=2986998 RepID=A0AA41YE59_9BACT|nr:tetraacyldisaccharide 4'-kinase [Gaoshiqia sediminis]MCW0484002.1 tetraacyldisaccharide 4'-kinase [Gaoshiqia sediminis]